MPALHLATASLPEIATVLAAALAPLAVMLVGFYKFAQTLMNESRAERKEEREVFTTALEQLGWKITEDVQVGKQLVAETRKNTEQIAKGNREAAERNGHLGEQNIQIADTVSKGFERMMKLADRNLESYQNQNIKKQTVTKQVVHNEVVKNQEVEGA